MRLSGQCAMWQPTAWVESFLRTRLLRRYFLDTWIPADVPDPDLLIRTSGEQRLSNYLLWQLAYTEFYFTEVPWPAFTKEDLWKAIEKYNTRERRYGGAEEA